MQYPVKFCVLFQEAHMQTERKIVKPWQALAMLVVGIAIIIVGLMVMKLNNRIVLAVDGVIMCLMAWCFGISYGAMRIAGGLVVAAIGYQMLFGGNSPNKAPIVRRDKDDYSFFPIAMPGIAGPGTIAVVIGFSTEIVELDDYVDMAIAFAWTALAIVATAATSWFVMRYADVITRRLGPSGTLVLGKLMGFLLICIGVQFVGSGIRTFATGG